MMTTISMREFFTIQMTNMFRDSVTCSWDHGTSTERGTARQVVAAYQRFKRISGGCFTSVRVIDRDANERSDVTWSDIADAVI